MRQFAAVIVGVAVLASAWGCAGPSKADLQQTRESREQGAKVLESFAGALAQDDLKGINALLAGQVPVDKRSRLLQQAITASRLELYTGYRLETREALARVSRRSWGRGRAEVGVTATNRRGKRFKDRFVLVREGDGWALADFELHRPVRYEAVDLAPEDREQVREKLVLLFNRLENGQVGQIYQDLPDTPAARLRVHTDQGFLARLFRIQPMSSNVLWDLDIVTRLDVSRWPDNSGELPLYRVSTNQVMAIYDIPYTCTERGINEEDNLRLEVLLVEKPASWDYKLIRFYGKILPGSR